MGYAKFRAIEAGTDSIMGEVWIALNTIVAAHNWGTETWVIYTTGGQRFRVSIPKGESPFDAEPD
jgi:hypothetical protein